MQQIIDLIGILATDDEIIGETGVIEKTSIYIPSSKELHYHIKMLSNEQIETYTANKKFFLGYLSSIKEYTKNENEIMDDDDKIEQFRKFIEKFIVVFHHTKPGAAIAPFCKISDMSLVKRPKNFDRNTMYQAVPVFEPYFMMREWEEGNRLQLRRDYEDLPSFLFKLLAGKHIGKVVGMQNTEEVPDFILWKDEQAVLAIGPFTGNNYQDAGYVLTGKQVRVYPLEEKMIDRIVMVHTNPTIAHLPVSVIKAVKSALAEKNGMDGRAFLNDISKQGKNYDLSNRKWEKEIKKSEKVMIDSIEYCCQERDIHFSFMDLVNFHVSMKIDSLVILSGMSGIGKSSLAELYAKAIGADFLNVPVRPSWNDDSDLLGYYDMMHKVYCPAENQVVSVLAEAMKNPEKMYIICFDEMNLARVEHYFSQFLSVLEKKERRLRLYDTALETETQNRERYPSSIVIGDNVRFLGTVNIDETTYHFSDKVLDRANMIQLHVENYALPYEGKYYIDRKELTWSSEEYNQYVVKDIAKNYTLRKCLWEMHELFLDNGLSCGIGPRVVTKIEEYLENVPKLSGEQQLSIREAIDLQIAQRILTKVRGREEQLMEIFSMSDNSIVDTGIMNILKKYQMLSEFKECKKIIIRKRKELKIYGYCV